MKAREYLEAAYGIKSSDFVLSLLVEANEASGELKRALDLSYYLLNIKPDNIFNLKRHARLLKGMGRTKEALESYERILEIDPDNKFAYRERINLMLSSKGTDEAIEQLDSIMKVSVASENAHVHGLKGDKLYKLKRYKEAINEYTKGLKLEPDLNGLLASYMLIV